MKGNEGKSGSGSDAGESPDPPNGEISDLGQKWIAFRDLWLEPFNAFLTLILLVMYALGLAGLDGVVGVLSQSVLALAAGVLGGRIANAISTVNSQAVLKARGTVAVRGLNLMLRNVSALDKRVDSFRRDAGDVLQSKNYEEILQMCRVLSEEGITSIENWTDIVPEARKASIAALLAELREGIEGLKAEKESLEQQLDGAKDAQNERDILINQIAGKDARITELESRFKNTALDALNKYVTPMTVANGSGGRKRVSLVDLLANPPPPPPPPLSGTRTPPASPNLGD
ncbi:hypothetical protein [Stenotrophomonas rhizophila]|uniref:hypothetical protein n=1 Tax=Stenotrophomonas rhizophila TaxID=216778 RepID=UPI0028AA2D00|nr:hypothetical protein [Stenotrophomonas rhizophila]